MLGLALRTYVEEAGRIERGQVYDRSLVEFCALWWAVGRLTRKRDSKLQLRGAGASIPTSGMTPKAW